MMHDWVISTLEIDWDKNVINITFKTASGDQNIVATEFAKLIVPKRENWGPSRSVYNVDKPMQLKNKNYKILIEMQSGDLITIEAKRIVLPRELQSNEEE